MLDLPNATNLCKHRWLYLGFIYDFNGNFLPGGAMNSKFNDACKVNLRDIF